MLFEKLDLIYFFIKDPLFVSMILIVIMALSIALFIHRKMEQFTTLNPFPQLNYKTAREMAESAGTTVRVKTGFSVGDVLKFDFVNNLFILDCRIWFQFDPSLLMLSLINQFYFEKGKILEKLTPTMKLIHGELFVEYPLRLEFSNNLNHVNFPIEDHRIFITVDNIATSAKDINFSSSASAINWSPDIHIFGWDPVDYYTYTGYSQSQLDSEHVETIVSHPRVIFAIDFNQIGIRNHGVIFIPIFVAFALSFIALGLNPYKQTSLMISLSAGGVTGLLAFRFVLESLTPKVGYYTLADRFWIIFLLMTMIQTMFCLYLITVPELYKENVATLQIMISIVLFIIVIIITFRFLYVKEKP